MNGAQIVQAEHVTIAIATYRRPALLTALLESLASEQNAMPFSVIVVDNDPAGSGKSVVEASACHAGYVMEERPGIVAARNTALALLESNSKAIVFVDDDEFVSPGWFDTLLGYFNATESDVVIGPVMSVFADDCPAWIPKGGFIQRPRHSTGTKLSTAATNNTIVRLSSLRELESPWFDDSFSNTGGSDAELFWRMNVRGASILWCDEAVVHEHVPSDRANLRWVFTRLVRLGNVSGRLHTRSHTRVVVAALGAGRFMYGCARTVMALAFGHGFRNAHLSHVGKGIGMVGAVLNRNVVEYRRK